MTIAEIRARCCGDPSGCVLCEVDGTAIDPVLFAERQLEQARAREAFAALQARPAASAAAIAIATRITARERGALRRQQLDALAGVDPARGSSRMRAGLVDRRHSRGSSG